MRAFILSLAFTASSTSMALAADLGQYRPGNAYQSVIAQGADVCESHCAGDAQCRSWNYVKTNPKTAGVCEFNANDVTPVPSAISISGTNSFGHNSAAARHSDRIIAGGTNTIRVGTQSVQKQPTTRQASRSNRRIVREPIPQGIRPQTASTQPVIRKTSPGSLTAQQNQYRSGHTSVQQSPLQPRQQAAPSRPQQAARAPQPRNIMPSNVMQRPQPNAMPQFQYELGAQGAVPPTQMRRPALANGYAPQVTPQVPQRATQQTAPNRVLPNGAGEYRNRRRQQGPTHQQAMRPQQPAFNQAQPYAAQRGQAYPPQMSPMQAQPSYGAQQAVPRGQQMPPQAMQKRTANQPMTYVDAQPSRLAPNMRAQPSPKSLAQGLTAEQAQQSLFGKLNDDVRVPNSGASVPRDPNAPISTSSSRPAGNVEQGPLGELVGAPSR